MTTQINIEVLRDQVWGAYAQVGGTLDQCKAGIFDTNAQAYYAGMVTGIDQAIAVRNASAALRDGPEAL